MVRNGPPVARPGLGSHVSNWLDPPASQTKITWRPRCLEGRGRRLAGRYADAAEVEGGRQPAERPVQERPAVQAVFGGAAPVHQTPRNAVPLA